MTDRSELPPNAVGTSQETTPALPGRDDLLRLLDRDALQALLDAVASALGVTVVVRDEHDALVMRGPEGAGACAAPDCVLAGESDGPDGPLRNCPHCGAACGFATVRFGGRVRARVDWSRPADRESAAVGAGAEEIQSAIREVASGVGAFAQKNLLLACEVAARQRERGFLDNIINAVADPIFVKDEAHRWIIVNDAFCRLMGHPREAVLGRSDIDFFPEEEARVFWEKDDYVLGTGEENVNDERFTDAEGLTHLISTKKRAFRDDAGGRVLVGVIRDLTESRAAEEELARYRERLEELVLARTRELEQTNAQLRFEVEERRRAEEQSRAMEQQIRHQQRLESIGRLAGGIAHDFNNLLTGIAGHVSLAAAGVADGNPVRDSLDEIGRAAQAASRLTRQLLAFGRKQVIEPRVVDANELVGELRRLLERVIGEDVALEVHLAEEPACARVDPGQVEQVLLNLAVNARDAMPDGGHMAIEVENVVLDEEGCRTRPTLAPGEYVALRVRDDGGGMDEATLRRAFEPFFTTKPPAQGTGLGLSTAYGIVQQHRGNIEATSAPGRGTTFTVHLPRVPDRPAAQPRAPQRVDTPTGDERVLVVEDEEMVREVASVMLRQLGYSVREAAHPDDALLLARDLTQPIDLLITDLVMPGMDGQTLADAVVSLRPECRVLFMSGYTDDVATAEGVLRPGTNFLNKPFSRETLAATVRRVLDRE